MELLFSMYLSRSKYKLALLDSFSFAFVSTPQLLLLCLLLLLAFEFVVLYLYFLCGGIQIFHSSRMDKNKDTVIARDSAMGIKTVQSLLFSVRVLTNIHHFVYCISLN